MCTLLTSMHSAVAGEFNEIPWQKMGGKGHYGPGNAGKRLPGLDNGSIRFCAVPFLASTLLVKILVAYPLPSERSNNAVAFP